MNSSSLFSVGNISVIPEVATSSPRVYTQHDEAEGIDIVQIKPGVSKQQLRNIGSLIVNQYSEHLAEPGVTTTAVPGLDVNNIGFTANTGDLVKIAIAVKAFVDGLT